MSLAAKTLKKQKYAYLTRIIQGLVLGGVGVFGGIMILKNGIGKAPSNDRGPAAMLYKFLSDMMSKGETAEKLVPICFAGFFFVLGAVGLYHVIRGIRSMASSHTALGKSVLQQAKSHEGFSELIAAIDKDMSWEPRAFGKVNIGREWILEMEAMRLENIKGIFWMDEGMEDYVLCCVDEAQNIWASSLTYKDERDDALKYLRGILPDAATGDKAAYVSYLRKDTIEVPSEVPVVKTLTIPSDTSFVFVGSSKIPTSNFTEEDVVKAFQELGEKERIVLQPLSLNEFKDMKIEFVHMGSGNWEIYISYVQNEKAHRITKSAGQGDTEIILDNLLKLKQLPDTSDWQM